MAKRVEMTKMPERARVYYNLELTLLKLGPLQEAQAALLLAHLRAPDDRTLPQALALAAMLVRGGQTANSLEWAENLAALAPADPRPKHLIARLRDEKLSLDRPSACAYRRGSQSMNRNRL